MAFVLIGSISIAADAIAQVTGKRAELTEDALRAAVRTGDLGTIDKRLDASRLKVDEAALRRPNERMMATIVIQNEEGVSYVSQLVKEYQLELARVEFKVAGDFGRPNTTVSLGPEYLYASDGPLQERLDYAKELAREQLRTFERSREAEQISNRIPLDRRQMLIYAADVVGDGVSIKGLYEEDQIKAIVPIDRPSAVSDFDSYRELFKSIHARRRHRD